MYKRNKDDQVWCQIALIPVLERHRQVDFCEFWDGLIYVASFTSARAT